MVAVHPSTVNTLGKQLLPKTFGQSNVNIAQQVVRPGGRPAALGWWPWAPRGGWVGGRPLRSVAECLRGGEVPLLRCWERWALCRWFPRACVSSPSWGFRLCGWNVGPSPGQGSVALTLIMVDVAYLPGKRGWCPCGAHSGSGALQDGRVPACPLPSRPTGGSRASLCSWDYAWRPPSCVPHP